MAESLRASRDNDKHRKRQRNKDKGEMSEKKGGDEGRAESTLLCAVCLETCVHPAKLPCGHIFCFLCLKGWLANQSQSRSCAVCRQDIPTDYLDHPHLLEVPVQAEKEAFEDGYQWFYEGRSGWWQYDERTSQELEAAFKSGQRTCELLIVGQLYIADFDAMLQLRRNDMSRRRRIKRDLASIPKKGIAGLRFDGLPNTTSSGDGTEPSTSQQLSPEETDLIVSEPRTSNEFSHLPDSAHNSVGEMLSYRVANGHRNVEKEDSDEDNNGFEEESESADEREVHCDEIEMNNSDNSQPNSEDLETQIACLSLR